MSIKRFALVKANSSSHMCNFFFYSRDQKKIAVICDFFGINCNSCVLKDLCDVMAEKELVRVAAGRQKTKIQRPKIL